jgi:hypothetical protein
MEIFLKSYNPLGTGYTKELHFLIMELFKDKNIQEGYKMREDLHLYDGVDHFFKNLERITPPEYVPTFEDILYVRSKTIGIYEIEFEFNKGKIIKVYIGKYKLLDVGGQRNERKKWKNGLLNLIFSI